MCYTNQLLGDGLCGHDIDTICIYRKERSTAPLNLSCLVSLIFFCVCVSLIRYDYLYVLLLRRTLCIAKRQGEKHKLRGRGARGPKIELIQVINPVLSVSCL